MYSFRITNVVYLNDSNVSPISSFIILSLLFMWTDLTLLLFQVRKSVTNAIYLVPHSSRQYFPYIFINTFFYCNSLKLYLNVLNSTFFLIYHYFCFDQFVLVIFIYFTLVFLVNCLLFSIFTANIYVVIAIIVFAFAIFIDKNN